MSNSPKIPEYKTTVFGLADTIDKNALNPKHLAEEIIQPPQPSILHYEVTRLTAEYLDKHLLALNHFLAGMIYGVDDFLYTSRFKKYYTPFLSEITTRYSYGVQLSDLGLKNIQDHVKRNKEILERPKCYQHGVIVNGYKKTNCDVTEKVNNFDDFAKAFGEKD